MNHGVGHFDNFHKNYKYSSTLFTSYSRSGISFLDSKILILVSDNFNTEDKGVGISGPLSFRLVYAAGRVASADNMFEMIRGLCSGLKTFLGYFLTIAFLIACN